MAQRDNHQFIPYRLPIVRDSNPKRIYVEYYVLHPVEKRLKRKIIKSNFYPTKRENVRQANMIASNLAIRLKNGYNPYLEDNNKHKYTRLTDALHKAISYKASEGLDVKTMNDYESRVSIFISWLELTKQESIFAFDLNRTIINNFIIYLSETRKVTNRTINNYIINLSALFSALELNGYVQKNPFKEIKKRKVAEKRRLIFSHGELSKFKKSLDEQPIGFKIAAMLCYYSGARISEIQKLRIYNINLEEGYIEFDGDGTKNQKIRTIPIIHDGLRNELKKYIAGFHPNFYLVGSTFKPEPIRYEWLKDRIGKMFREIAKQHNFRKGITFYSLKDTMVSQLLKNKVDPKLIQLLMGHSSLNTTDLYAKKHKPTFGDDLKDKFDII